MRQAHQPEDGCTGSQKIINDQHLFARFKILGGDDELNFIALGMRWRNSQVYRIWHSDWAVLARINHRQVEVARCHQCRSDARNFCSEDASGHGERKAPRKLKPALIHQLWVDLMVNQTVYFKNPATKVLSLGSDAILQ